MPPKKNKGANNKNNKPNEKKSKKQVEEDEFEKLLSDLTKVTKQVGQEKEKQLQQEQQMRSEIHKKHEDLLKKKETNNFEAALLQRKRQMEFQEILQKLMMAQRPFLNAPKTDFTGETVDTNSHFKVAVGEMQGWRNSMEDNHFINVQFAPADASEGLFGVFDGHSGKQSADLCSQKLPAICAAHRGDDGKGAVDLTAAYLAMDEVLRKEVKDDSGCTAVVVHVSAAAVRCASAGDSRAVLCREALPGAGALPEDEAEVSVGGRTFRVRALAHDHKPEVEAEKARIVAAGGFVQDNRVNGQLAMSRALGDFSYKTEKARGVDEQLVIPVPDVAEVPRGADAAVAERFVVLACDGIFDVLSNEELVQLVLQKKLEESLTNEQVCEAVCRRCLAPPDGPGGQPSRPDGTDNMTVMIVDLE